MAKDLNVFDKEYGLLINGAWTKPGVLLDSYNPANGEALAKFTDATDADVDAAVAAAQEAGGGQAVALFLPQPGDPSSTYTVWISQGARFAPRKSPDDVAVSIAVNVDPGTGRTTLPSTPGHRPTTRAD